MEYTQGEWKARKLLPDTHGIITKEAWEIATPEYDVATLIEHSAPIRRESDANLIAAAPRMYEALEYLTETVARLDGYTKDNSESFAMSIEALAKAKGG